MAEVKYFRAYRDGGDDYIDFPLFIFVSGENVSVDDIGSLLECSTVCSNKFYDITTFNQGYIEPNYIDAFFGMPTCSSHDEVLSFWNIPKPSSTSDYDYYYDSAKKYGFRLHIQSSGNFTVSQTYINGSRYSGLSNNFFFNSVSGSNTGRYFLGIIGGLNIDTSTYFEMDYAYFTASSSTKNRYRQYYSGSSGGTFYNGCRDFIRAMLDSGVSPIEPTPPEPPSTDPYNGGGYSGSGGGPGTGGQTGTGGNYDTTSDPVPVPNLPTSIATGSGLFTAYNPNASQLAYFADKLWNRDPTTIDDWFRMLFGGDAFNSIIGLTLLPVSPSTGAPKNIILGNWDTGASAPVITSQYVEVPFGSLTLSEFWGNSIDYSPYTRVQLALPYIGIVDVDTDDVIGSVNTLTYHIDVFSGAICAMLHCVKGNLSSVIYQWSGSCGVTLPITGQSFNAVIGAIMGVGAAALGGIAMASGPVGAAIGTAGSLAVGTGAVTGAAANMFGTMKGKVQKSGSFNASSGALGIMTPYFIITRPVQSIPSTQQATKGYPSNISAHLGDLSGYTEVTEVHLHNIPGTKDEVLEIESLLKKGVIF